MRIRERIHGGASKLRHALTPTPAAWTGAALGVYAIGLAAVVALFVIGFLFNFAWQKLPAFFVWIGVTILIGLAGILAASIIMRLPRAYRLALAVCAPFVLLMVFPGDTATQVTGGAALLLFASLIGGGIASVRQAGPARPKAAIAAVLLGGLGLASGAHAIFSEKEPANPALEAFTLQDRTLDLPNPGLAGDYEVLTLTYGSGTDKRRPEFGKEADLVSETVDGSKLIDSWDGFSGWLRTSYWGFDVTELPLQACVWYPDGEGPFPVVLIVHGNHEMEEYSDPGYAYLGEFLASRGIILASVDQNFINFALSAFVDILANSQGLEEENDARGWLLLKHLALWRDWNADPGNPFFGKVDMDRVALIGHSRGGEAIGIAAAFNALDRYPDDASLAFDFGFNLRGVIAIAPVYGQYQPRERPTPVRDVNYFTIHGSMDGDVQSFEGLGQYSRVTFSGDTNRFRSALYVVGANHGQFNTIWGNRDTWLYNAWVLDFDRIMEAEAQRDIARVYFGAFLDVVLNGRTEYLPIFRDARYAAAWLPDTFFINRFSGSSERVIANFEEDIDPTTLTRPGGRIETANLSRWYETGNQLKRDELDTHAAVVAWDKEFSEETARIDFRLPTPMDGDLLVASISAADVATLPIGWDEPENETADAVPEDNAEHEDDTPLDWTVEMTDENGHRASLPLSHDAVLYPLINAIPRRARFLEFEEPTEILFRRFELPLTAFVGKNREFDATSVRQISFVFDRSERGAIIIDDIASAKEK